MRWKQIVLVGTILGSFFCVTGCKITTHPEKITGDIAFEVLEEDEVPEELMEIIEKKKEEPFLSTYGDGEFLYVGQGYGQKEFDGYEIEVDSFVESEHFLYFHTILKGSYDAKENITFPWIVVRTKWSDKSVVYRKGVVEDGDFKDEYSDE